MFNLVGLFLCVGTLRRRFVYFNNSRISGGDPGFSKILTPSTTITPVTWAAVPSKEEVLLLLIHFWSSSFWIVGALCLVLVLLCITWCPFWFPSRFDEGEGAV